MVYHMGKSLKLNKKFKKIKKKNQLANDKPWFLHVTWNKMEENANDFFNYVVVE